MNRVGTAGLVAILAGLMPGVVVAQKRPLTIGIVTGQLQNPGADSFAPFTAWLNTMVSGQSFTMAPLATIEDLLRAVEQRKIDFAFTTPVAMEELDELYGARPIATVMQPAADGQNYPWLAGAVFTKAARTDIQIVNDIRGKRVVALSPLALGGWLSAVREWRQAGIREDSDLGSLRFVFSYATVVDEVCRGHADIGVLSASALITAAPLCRDKLRVIPAASGGRDPRYPADVSTRLYPEEAFAVTGDEDEAVVAQLTTALLAIEPGSDVAKAATVGAFTAPLSYEPVEQLMRDLRLHPFENNGRLTFRQAVVQYGIWIVGILTAFLVVLSWTLLRARRLNARLKEAEYFRRRVFEGSHLAMVVMDEETQTFIDCNPAAAAIYGFGSREETLGKTPADVSAPSQADGNATDPDGRHYTERAIDEGSVVFEWRHRRPSGEFWDAEVHLMAFRSGEKRFLQFTLEDITRRKKTEEMRAMLASVLEASHDFIAIAAIHRAQEPPERRAIGEEPLHSAGSGGVNLRDSLGAVTYLNRGAKLLIGLDESDTIRQLRVEDFFAPKEKEDFSDTVMPTLLRDGWVRTESKLRHFRSSQEISVQMEGMVIRDARGQPACLATVMWDLTERYEAERQREQLEARLVQAQKMEALGRLIGGIVHDFNNSLTVILGYAELLASSDGLNEVQQRELTGIRRAGEHSRDMVRQLLAFSRQQIISPRPLDLNLSIAQSHEVMHRLVGEDVELNVFPGRDLWSAMLDTTQVYQVLMNLAANARDAMPGGGKLTIETSNTSIDENYPQRDPEAKPGEYVMLAVADTGIGMDAATVAQVFDPFFTTKAEGRGTGLGLATVYGIVRQNRGFINVYSEPGIGTTFKIYFPRLPGTPGEANAAPDCPILEAALMSRDAKASILLVEDDKLVRDMTADTLTRLGYALLVATGPGEAIGICRSRETPVDLVITDVVMPAMKGTELRDRLVEIRPGLKVLFVSGYTSNVIMDRGMLRTGVEFLQKPYSAKGLSDKIEAILNMTET